MPPPTTPEKPTVVAYAVLTADSLAHGPPSGSLVVDTGRQGRTRSYPAQPVQGFSALIADDDGTFFALSDNGFGAIENSSDYLLRIYRLRADFARRDLHVEEFVQLSDPARLIPFPIVNEFTDDRLLTGADFDLESMQRAPDGSWWLADEFGPFLLHADGEGRLIDAPFAVPDPEGGGELRAAQNPYNEEGALVRTLGALRARALARGGRSPVVSPWHLLVADGDPRTYAPLREHPPAQSGLVPASSEVADVRSLRSAGFEVVPYTVDSEQRMAELMKLGASGIISDAPNVLLRFARAQQPPLTLEDGRIDRTRFDAQGHRGARALRPENTLPSMEAALDHLVTTLETDLGLTADGAVILSHDYVLEDEKCRRLDGGRYGRADEVLIRDTSLDRIQSSFTCDVLHPDFPGQKNDVSLSPVAVAFAQMVELPHAYSPPTLDQLFDFVDFYVAYYESGPGRLEDTAGVRALAAREVRFNIEAKTNPRREFREFTPDRAALTDAIIRAVTRRRLEARVDVQSFDWAVLLQVQDANPAIGGVALIGDFPMLAAPRGRTHGGGNLRGENDGPSPWLAGMPWPYRVTTRDRPFRVKTSGGFEAMALSPDGRSLWPMLEKPLDGASTREVVAFRFDLTEKRFTGERLRYPLSDTAVGVSDFVLFAPDRGLVVERDEARGDPLAFKWIFEVVLPDAGEAIRKVPRVNLLALVDGIAGTRARATGVGVGAARESDPFPLWTLEAIAVLSPTRIAVMNDNQVPFSPDDHAVGAPEHSELILIDLPQPLGPDTAADESEDAVTWVR